MDKELSVIFYWKRDICFGKRGFFENILIRELCDVFMFVNGNGVFYLLVEIGKVKFFLIFDVVYK